MSTENLNEDTQEELTPEDEFASAFAELTEPEGKPAEKPAEAPIAEAQPAEETPAEEPVAEAPVEEPAAEEPAAEEPAEEQTNFAEELAKLRNEIKKPAPEPEAPAAEAQPETPLLSEEDQNFLNEYEKDWPDISKAEALKRRIELNNVVKYVFEQVSQTIAPVIEHYKSSEYNEHENAIKSVHEDYDQVRQQVVDWVGSQQGTRAKVFNEIVQSGTAEEIADLVTIWKEATGKAAPPVAQGVRSTSTPTEPPPKAKQAAQKLSVVSSKRTTMPAVTDPADYDGAWAEATGKL